MPPLQKFRSYEISEDAEGNSLELWRSEREVVCLAASAAQHRLVELHVLAGVDTSSPASQPQVDAFRAQVTALLRLNDPRLIEVREAGEDEGMLFYVTEFIDGEPLDEYLSRCQPLPAWLAVEIARQLTEGLIRLRGEPQLLAIANITRARLTLEGETSADAAVKLADFHLGTPFSPPQPELRALEARLVREIGQLLGSALSSIEPEKLDARQMAALPVPVELARVLARLVPHATRQTLTDLPALLKALETCARDPTLAALPERLPPALRPLLPLRGHFPDLAQLAAALGGGCRLERQPFDAAQPYAQRAFAETRSVLAHLLPPSRILPPAYGPALRLAAERAAAAPSPHLIPVLSLAPGGEPEWFLEESPPRLSLESARRLRRSFTPSEAAVLLRAIDQAVTAVEKIGLPPAALCPQHIYLEFTATPPPGDDALAAQPMGRWPAFVIKLRAHPIPVQLLQPHRFRREKLLGKGPRTRQEAVLTGLQSPVAADYAALFAWLCGSSALSAEVSRLVSQTAAGTGEPDRQKFLGKLFSLLPAASPQEPDERPAPAIESRKKSAKKRSIAAAAAAGTGASGQPDAAAVAAENDDSAGESHAPFSSLLAPDAAPDASEEDAETEPAGGFAEILLGKSVAPPAPAAAFPAWAASENEDEPDGSAPPIGALFGGGPLPDDETAADEDGPFDFHSYAPMREGPGAAKLILFVVLAALLIAIIMAQLTGLAPWK